MEPIHDRVSRSPSKPHMESTCMQPLIQASKEAHAQLRKLKGSIVWQVGDQVYANL